MLWACGALVLTLRFQEIIVRDVHVDHGLLWKLRNAARAKDEKERYVSRVSRERTMPVDVHHKSAGRACECKLQGAVSLPRPHHATLELDLARATRPLLAAKNHARLLHGLDHLAALEALHRDVTVEGLHDHLNRVALLVAL